MSLKSKLTKTGEKHENLRRGTDYSANLVALGGLSAGISELSSTAATDVPNEKPFAPDTSAAGGTYIDYFLPIFDTFIFHHLGTAENISGTGSQYYQGITGRATGEDRWYAVPTPGEAPTGASFAMNYTPGNYSGTFPITGGNIPKTAHSLPIGLINMWSDYDNNTPDLISGITIAPRTPTRSILAFNLSSLGKTYSIGPTKLYLTLENHNQWNESGG